MKLSTAELQFLEQISLGKRDVHLIADSIDKSKSQSYTIFKKLIAKGLIDSNSKPINNTSISILLEIIQESSQLIKILAGSGIPILQSLLEEKTIAQIGKETGLHQAMIYRKLQNMRHLSIIKGKKIILNDKIWPQLRKFVSELSKYESTVDPNIPLGSTIYYKGKKSLVFSNRVELNATLTAFSVFENYGIKLLLTKYYYCLPKKVLTTKEVFFHALKITEKEHTVRNIIFIALFYLKYTRELISIKHEILSILKQVLQNKSIEGYPSFFELKEKCELYDIKI